ncbi:MAG: hypothetical protein D6805_05035 [Planctomycetota bacterium]|nr:MAG: hypothetical protein D6805_05035 [Planctomycetota bacterium]
MQRFRFRFRLFPLGIFTMMFDPEKLRELIREGCRGGYRMLRREFTFEMRRLFLIFRVAAFGFIFRKDEDNPEPEYDYRVKVYKTRFFTRTVNTQKMEQILNEGAEGGYELFFAAKYPTRFLFIFPRESYMFFFRKPIAGEGGRYSYQVVQVPYRFFTRTIDPNRYEQDLNTHGRNAQLKLTFRDERRLFLIFVQPTAVCIFERKRE